MKSFLMLISLTFLMSAPSSFARSEGGKKGMGKILKQLDLTPKQRTQLKEARGEGKSGDKEKKEEMKELRKQMKAKFVSDAPESELRTLHEKMSELKGKKHTEKFNKLSEKNFND